jgi:hypothetical protein
MTKKTVILLSLSLLLHACTSKHLLPSSAQKPMGRATGMTVMMA